MCEKKIVNPWIVNPFFYYSFFWLVTILFYYISPSGLYMELNHGLLIFLLITIVVAIIIAIQFNINYKNKVIKIRYYKPKGIILVTLLILYVFEFIYSKSVPLITGETYGEFGIPTLHVIIVTFSCYYAIKNYFQYIAFKKNKCLLNFIIIVTYFILIFSRGILVFLFSIIIALTTFDKIIKIHHLIIFLLIVFIFSWLFGIAGNIRSGYSWNDSGVIIYFSDIPIDRHSLLAPFIWVEEYIVCSLRNLNFNINFTPVTNSIFGLLYSIIPDFLSKRLFLEYSIIPELQVEAFTTCTMYTNVYISFGYLGMILNFIIYFIIYFIFTHIKMIDETNKIIGFSILSMIFALSIFNDMLWYSGYSFTLIYCFLFGLKPSLGQFIPYISTSTKGDRIWKNH